MKIDLYHHFPGDEHLAHKMDRILDLLQAQGVTMSNLSDAVDALQGRITEDVQHLQDVIAGLTADLAAALADDAADAATIAEKQAEIDAINADVAATVERITAIDPVSDFPGVEEPPVE